MQVRPRSLSLVSPGDRRQSRLSQDSLTPRDWQRSRVRFLAQVNDGCRVRHRLAGGARLPYFSAVHATTISSDAIDHLLSLERHVIPEVAPRTDVLAFDVAQAERCPATAWRLAGACLLLRCAGRRRSRTISQASAWTTLTTPGHQ